TAASGLFRGRRADWRDRGPGQCAGGGQSQLRAGHAGPLFQRGGSADGGLSHDQHHGESAAGEVPAAVRPAEFRPVHAGRLCAGDAVAPVRPRLSVVGACTGGQRHGGGRADDADHPLSDAGHARAQAACRGDAGHFHSATGDAAGAGAVAGPAGMGRSAHAVSVRAGAGAGHAGGDHGAAPAALRARPVLHLQHRHGADGDDGGGHDAAPAGLRGLPFGAAADHAAAPVAERGLHPRGAARRPHRRGRRGQGDR
ncbi:hypothetical protein OY671_008703, partial [Metschnikowia pulcherrima]